jgi:hypothetical protein
MEDAMIEEVVRWSTLVAAVAIFCEGVKSFVDCDPLETARSRSKIAFEKVNSPSLMRRVHC